MSKIPIPNPIRPFLAAFSLLLLLGCTPLANPFSAEALRQATALKARSLALINSGDEPFSRHQDRAEALLISIAEAYEFARARGQRNSDEAALQWAEILDEDGGSVGAFVALWRENGRVNEFFIPQFHEVVSLQFDTIIDLETGRQRPGS